MIHMKGKREDDSHVGKMVVAYPCEDARRLTPTDGGPTRDQKVSTVNLAVLLVLENMPEACFRLGCGPR